MQILSCTSMGARLIVCNNMKYAHIVGTIAQAERQVVHSPILISFSHGMVTASLAGSSGDLTNLTH